MLARVHRAPIQGANQACEGEICRRSRVPANGSSGNLSRGTTLSIEKCTSQVKNGKVLTASSVQALQASFRRSRGCWRGYPGQLP